MSLYLALRSTFRRLAPNWFRRAIWSKRNPLFTTLVAWKLRLERTAQHDDIYDSSYYDDIEAIAVRSAPHIARSICRDYRPGLVLDVGCGTGELVAALATNGVDARGLERSLAAIDRCRQRGLNVTEFDLESPQPYDLMADVIVSMEVAEHLPESLADTYMDFLCSHARVVVLTAARPGQAGTDHVNEQPQTYWIEKAQRRGMRYDQGRSMEWREEWRRDGVAGCYANNLMVFERL